MAGSKETTRQKMINLMYLVFIAMLALNISKEVLGTLGILKEDITKATVETEAQIDFAYTKIESNSENQRYAATLEEKDNLQSATNDFYNYLQSIIDMLEKDEAGNLDESLRKTIEIEGEEITSWDYQLMTKGKELQDYFFLKPTIDVKDGLRLEANDNGAKFIELYSSFDEKIIEVLDSINIKNERYGVEPFDFSPIKSDLKSRFPFSDDGTVIDRDGDKQAYLRYHFDGFPLIASISKIANMQSNIRAVESRILVAILGGIAVDEGDVGKNYSTNLYSDKSSHYVNSIVDAKVVLGRNDDNFQPSKVELAVDGVSLSDNEYLIERGGVVLNKAFRIPKKYKLTGTLFFKQDGEEKQVDVNQTFDVINKPNSAIVSLDANRTLYRGLRNPVSIAFPGVANESSIRVSSEGAELQRISGLTYSVVPGPESQVRITVSGTINDETVVDRDGNIFDVEDAPPAEGSISVTEGGETFLYCAEEDCSFEIPPFDLIEGTVQGVKPSWFKYDYSINVFRFSVKVGDLPETEISGNKISADNNVVRYINNANPGTIVTIKILSAEKNDAGFKSPQDVKQFKLQIR